MIFMVGSMLAPMAPDTAVIPWLRGSLGLSSAGECTLIGSSGIKVC
jgi:hypothetical protein